MPIVHRAASNGIGSETIGAPILWASRHLPYFPKAIAIMSSAASVRVEKDLLGTLEVPADAYYGIQTLRAVQNFRLSGVP